MSSMGRNFGLAFLAVAMVVVVAFSMSEPGNAAPGDKTTPPTIYPARTPMPGYKTPAPNPFAEMSSEQQATAIATARASFEQRLEVWMANLDISTLDLQELPRAEAMVLSQPGKATLDEAVDAATAIIIGTVTGLRPDRFSTVITVNVERSLKGNIARRPIQIIQGSGFQPGLDWSGVVIADHPNDPLMLPGTRAVLFLQKSSSPDAEFSIQGFSGHYELKAGSVTVLGGNTFGAAIAGEPEATFVSQILSAVARTSR